MILTEEQRGALAHAINYIDETDLPVGELDGFDREVLRAMIDSSDPIPDVTELVELLAAGEHEQWAVWAQAILDSEPGLSDRRKATWPEMIATPYENLSEELKDEDRRVVHLRSQAALDYIQQQSTEIERLREVIKTHNTREESALAEILMNELLVRQNAQIKELEAENKRVLLELQKSKNRNMCEKRVKKDMQQAARIKELEDALVEERAKQFDVDEPCPARTHHEYCDILKGLCDGFPHMWKQCPRKPEKLDAARQQLQAEGKIGSDAKPHCWQITEERKAAIRGAEIALRDAVLDSNDPHCWDAETAVLRGMLEEAYHDKP